jgi:hypothetical protein
MVHKLYELFLDELPVYRACERFWEQLSTNISNSIGSVADWHPWIPRSYAKGTPMELDGNPIWDGRSNQLDRAYRIIQGRAVGDTLEIAAWLKGYEEEYTEMPRYELVISLALSQESANLADALLRKWMTPETTPEDMQEFIAEIIPCSQPSPKTAI